MAPRATLLKHGREGSHAWFALIVCVAMLAQCLIAQTHIHRYLSNPTPIATIDLHTAFGAPLDHRHPAGAPPNPHQNTAVCFLCQAAVAGAGVLQAAPALVIVDQRAIDNVPTYESAGASALVSHHWQGRAPPISTAI